MVRAVHSESSLPQAAVGSKRHARGGRELISLGEKSRIAVGLLAAALLIGALAWPIVFTNREFNADVVKHLWDMWKQSMAIRANLHPTFFLNYSHAVFYPQYAFYGGTLFAITGTLSLLAGDAPLETYVCAYLACFASAYGGWYWMAHMAGLRGWRAHAPAAVFLTSAYYIAEVYARGDLPEFTGVSMIPLMVASALSILRADRLRIWPALALTASSVLFFGSHNLTVIWGSTFIALAGAVVLLCIPQARRWLTWHGVVRVGILVVPALLLSAWFLLPALAYQAHTEISMQYTYWRAALQQSVIWVSVRHLFTLSRAPATGPGSDFALSLPILAMLWSLVGIALAWRGHLRGPWRRMLLICVGLAALATVVMTHPRLILFLPKPFVMLQFSYRFESYVNLAVSGAVLATLVVVQRAGRRARLWAWVLIPVLAVSLVGAIQQVDANPNGGDRASALDNPLKPVPTETVLYDYADAHLPFLNDPSGEPAEIKFPVSAIRDERVSRVVHLHPGQLVYTNIGGGPEFVHVSGAKLIGINRRGNGVLEIGPSIAHAKPGSEGADAHRWTEVISLSPATVLPVVLGRVLSLLAAAFLIGVFVVLAVRHARTRRASGADPRG